MFLSDDRVLDVSLGTAQLRLANLIRDGWLSGASATAYQDGMDHLLQVGPLGDLPGTSRLVRIWFVDPLYRDDTMTVGLRWETVGRTAGLFPVLDTKERTSTGPMSRLDQLVSRPAGGRVSGMGNAQLQQHLGSG